MAESQNFKKILLLLSDCHVEYLIVGGYAVMKYTEPRFTKDLDIWVGNSPENSGRVFAALARFGAPLRNDGVTDKTFSVSGCTFPDAWSRRVPGVMFGAPVHFISLPDLIFNKKATGRASDLEHIGLLEDLESA